MSANRVRGTTVTVFSPGEVEEILDLSNAMVRRYSDALETVTGNKVMRVNRSRVFTEDEVEVLKQARAALDASGTNLTIEQAIRRVLGMEAASSSVADTASYFSPILERLDVLTVLVVSLEKEVKALRREVKATKR
jgi:DNA-binding transcriptional MerR regulator